MDYNHGSFACGISLMKLIFFTDLDGTLLDHKTYDFSPALPAIRALKSRGIPLIMASSKTGAELHPLRSTLNLEAWPAIVENGAGELPPNGEPDEDSSEYRRLRSLLDELPETKRQQYRGFGDMSVNEVVALTGLSADSARLAITRLHRTRSLYRPGA